MSILLRILLGLPVGVGVLQLTWKLIPAFPPVTFHRMGFADHFPGLWDVRVHERCTP